MSYILTFDIGTTSVKTCLFDEKLICVSSANEEYMLITGENGTIVELAPQDYWQAVKNGILETVPDLSRRREIKAICITTQGETLIPVDRHGRELGNAIVWLDSRAGEEADYISSLDVAEEIYNRTGVPEVDSLTPLSKLLWMKRHEPDIYENTYKFLLLEDYIIYRLTGVFASEKALMGSTAYYDIREGRVFEEVFRQTELDSGKIPEVYDCGSIIAGVSDKGAGETGLPQGIAVVAGAMDQIAAAVGGGNVHSGVVTETTGTAMVIMTAVDESCFTNKERVRICPHILPNQYFMIPYCVTAGMVLKWFKDEFCFEQVEEAQQSGKNVYMLLDQLAEESAAGANGLLLIPYLNGILQPENRPDMRGVFFGVSLDTKKPQFVRAIFEGVGYMLRENLEMMEAAGVKVEEIRSFGGGAKSQIWQQIKADISRKRICTMKETECASLGVAAIAAVTMGFYPDIETAVAVNQVSQIQEPDEKKSQIYEGLYKRYLNVLERVKVLF